LLPAGGEVIIDKPEDGWQQCAANNLRIFSEFTMTLSHQILAV
jgi:hypothetical protein